MYIADFGELKRLEWKAMEWEKKKSKWNIETEKIEKIYLQAQSKTQRETSI